MAKWIIIGLLLVIGAMWFFWPSNKPDYSLHEARIAQREQAISELQVENAKLLSRIKADSVSHKIEVQAYKDRDKKKSREIARIKASPEVIRIRSESTSIDSLITIYDSVVTAKDEHISIQEKYIVNLQTDLKSIEANFESRVSLLQENSNDKDKIIESQSQELKKQKRRNRLHKFVTIPVAVIAFLVGSQL